MEDVIDHYYQGSMEFTERQTYEFWKYNRSKYATWLHYRHKSYQGIDVWDKVILSKLNNGNTVVYDSQAIYWNRLIDSVRIIENTVPKIVEPFVETLTPEMVQTLRGQVHNLLLFRPLSIKLTGSLVDYLTTSMFTRSGITPKLVDWLADDAKIFLSVGQEFFDFNRLRTTLLQFLEGELAELEQHGFKTLLFKNSRNDTINGNIKIILERF